MAIHKENNRDRVAPGVCFRRTERDSRGLAQSSVVVLNAPR
jgi:hypothetical protein